LNLANKKNQAQRGQALIEYTLLVMMVSMVFWVGIKNSDLSQQMALAWSRVSDCVAAPAACDSAS
jgi:Flp pilus assembly pilin Flp